MISIELHNRIKAANKKIQLTSQMIGNAFVIGYLALVIFSTGWEHWMVVFIAILGVINMPKKGADKALRILMERAAEIEYIEIEKEKSAIELDIKLHGDNREYEIKLPENLANDIIRDLKNELPNVQFINEKVPSLKDLFNQLK